MSNSHSITMQAIHKRIQYHKEALRKLETAIEILESLDLEEELQEEINELEGIENVGPVDAVRMLFEEQGTLGAMWRPKEIKILLNKKINNKQIRVQSVRTPDQFVDSSIRNLVKQGFLTKTKLEGAVYYVRNTDKDQNRSTETGTIFDQQHED